jgi:D-beta-D-heptose 7-phosphate kinase/D-beta-D-heptose 1-phosphate adenosyltransferase
MSILVIGDVMLDRYFWGDITRISPEVPVPVCNLRDVTYSLGGAANVAHNLVNLGVKVMLIGLVGDDDMAGRVGELLEEKGIASGLLVDDTRPTIVKTRVIGSSQHIVRIDDEVVKPLGDDLTAELKKKVSATAKKASGVILSDYAKGVLLDDDTCRWIVDECRRAGAMVFVDPKSTRWGRYAGATCVTPNRKELHEAARAAGIASEDVADIARELRETHSLEHVLVTLGPDGMRLFSQDGDQSFTNVVREVYDVSGAGDTVIATFAASVCAGSDAVEAARCANAAAGIVVGKIGTYPVSTDELQEALGMERYRTDKECSLDEALHKVAFWRSEGNSVVFTNGCFDILHAGHVLLFQEARKLGDKLVVAINSDESVRRIKSDPRPILGEKERLQILSAIEHIDMLIMFDEDEPVDLIAHIRPDVLAKGSDYTEAEVVGADVVKSYGGTITLIPVLENTSVSDIMKKLRRADR